MPPTDAYPLSLHDALPIYVAQRLGVLHRRNEGVEAHRLEGAIGGAAREAVDELDLPGPLRPRHRRSPRLNSSHGYRPYAPFCSEYKDSAGRLLLALAPLES